MRDVIQVGDRRIGAGCPTFLAAEVGINHNGNLDVAHRMIDAAATAGADGVKFQNFRAEDFISTKELTYEYVVSSETVRESQLEMFKRYQTRPEWLSELKEHCDQAGVVFFSTPTSQQGIEELVELGAPLLKNGSDYLGNSELIGLMASTKIPVVVSTGMADQDDVADAVSAFLDAGGEELVLLHCTSVYPTPPEEVHVRKMVTLRELFGCPVGLSDHSMGVVSAVTAVALGGCFIEKHFTLDRTMEGPDHRFSADPDEWARLVEAVRTSEAVLGSPEISPSPLEEYARRNYRLSCVATRDLEADHELVRDDVAFKRPGWGIPPKNVKVILGRRLDRKLPMGHIFEFDDFG